MRLRSEETDRVQGIPPLTISVTASRHDFPKQSKSLCQSANRSRGQVSAIILRRGGVGMYKFQCYIWAAKPAIFRCRLSLKKACFDSQNIVKFTLIPYCVVFLLKKSSRYLDKPTRALRLLQRALLVTLSTIVESLICCYNTYNTRKFEAYFSLLRRHKRSCPSYMTYHIHAIKLILGQHLINQSAIGSPGEGNDFIPS